MNKYRKKPVVIEALQFNGENWDEISDFCKDMDINNNQMIIKTLEGFHVANTGDYIIKGVEGEFYPCKPDIFWKTHEFETVSTTPTIKAESKKC
tara:strand:+ start:27976 stop:28257 length:282 start_codon:yes stop_codon:yes gene_type:complete